MWIVMYLSIALIPPCDFVLSHESVQVSTIYPIKDPLCVIKIFFSVSSLPGVGNSMILIWCKTSSVTLRYAFICSFLTDADKHTLEINFKFFYSIVKHLKLQWFFLNGTFNIWFTNNIFNNFYLSIKTSFEKEKLFFYFLLSSHTGKIG